MKIVNFQGNIFDLSVCRTRPTLSPSATAHLQSSDKLERFCKFLAEMEAEGLLKDSAPKGTIVYADDQFINQELLKMQFR